MTYSLDRLNQLSSVLKCSVLEASVKPIYEESLSILVNHNPSLNLSW